MMPTWVFSFGRIIPTVFLSVTGFLMLFLMYYKSSPPKICPPIPVQYGPVGHYNDTNKPIPSQSGPVGHYKDTNKPILLLWFWPNNMPFDFNDCKKLFNIDGCHLSDNRSMFSEANAVLIFHGAIKDDLSNLPATPRPEVQRWIWFNMDVPAKTRKIPGINSLFNLTLSYRQDADIHVRWRIKATKEKVTDFVLPKKDKLLCWIVGNHNPANDTRESFSYYKQLVKHIKVDFIGTEFFTFSKDEDYFTAISRCKFYLSFEDSIAKDYITETFNGPLAVGTVPVVLGPPRQNYEDFAPGDSFIHVNDFKDAKALADFIQTLDKDDRSYRKFFQWREYLSARRHLIGQNQRFTHAICSACDYVSRTKEYRVVNNLQTWCFGNPKKRR